ncbi:MAG: tRNA (adenosine(37)-N6)-dimethylallyltransferase MiaA [Lachnospiraceae bacterium]|nr:tRNA (adenosine(37)-N6)-dimethylallyltransferase MiaA [Lachnospiraceae bacterium]
MKDPLVIIAGPTAVGKSDCAIALARRIGGEVISADSMQVYRGMDIGTAKIMPDQMQGVPHHLIDILDPSEPFDVVLFRSLAKEAVRDIVSRGRIPILTGGTGFYIQALLYDIDFTEDAQNPAVRKKYEDLGARIGSEALHSLLKERDPEAAEAIPAGNRKRVIRALEYFEVTGEKISVHNERMRRREAAYNSAFFVLTDKRELLYDRINKRVTKMLDEGLEAEVVRLKEQGCRRGMVSMQGIGYKEVLDHLDGLCTMEEAADRIRQESRHFAKRQLTWFRRERDVIWIDRQQFISQEMITEYMIRILKERNLILDTE